jgi:phospho-N-acetylmuramoyl-pentapeptide-transferase
MLYHFFNYINQNFDFPGSGLFQFISFRAGMAVITSLVITLVFGGRLIKFLQRKQVGESIRDLGLEGQMVKAGTPTMGGVIILAGIIVPTILFCQVRQHLYSINACCNRLVRIDWFSRRLH